MMEELELKTLQERTGHAPPAPIEPKYFERRMEARYPTRDAAELELLPGPNPAICGTVLDVSRSGLRIALAVAVTKARNLKIKLQNTVILGEVRYCRPVKGGFHAGILIQEVIRDAEPTEPHIEQEHLSLYAVGKGLTVAEVIEVREHLMRCEACRVRLFATDALLNPSKQKNGR